MTEWTLISDNGINALGTMLLILSGKDSPSPLYSPAPGLLSRVRA
jgi:hypothetical protein